MSHPPTSSPSTHSCGKVGQLAYFGRLARISGFCRLSTYANWPTFPQLWVDGELVGGCDILIEMYQRGELQQLIKETAAKYKTEEPDAE